MYVHRCMREFNTVLSLMLYMSMISAFEGALFCAFLDSYAFMENTQAPMGVDVLLTPKSSSRLLLCVTAVIITQISLGTAYTSSSAMTQKPRELGHL